jgi:hypothetical protein
MLVSLCSDRTKINPPRLNVVGIEAAGVADEEGMEMWLVTLSISNANNVPFDPENTRYVKSCLYVEDGARAIEARVTNNWVGIRSGLACWMSPGQKHEKSFLMPEGASSCRVCLKYTNAVMYSGRLAGLARRLPRFLRSRLSNSFWQWAGFARYRPSSNWQEISIEIPFPTSGLPVSKLFE